MTPDGTCLVHLVWAPLGPEPLARFVDSYRRHDAGAHHRLLVVLNGFRAGDDLTLWRRSLADLDHEELCLYRPVLDLSAYREVTERVPADRYCFVNSYTEVLADEWLGALVDGLCTPGVGIVGATGSWGSIRSYNRFALGLGGPYSRVFADRRRTMATLDAVAKSSQDPLPDRRPPVKVPVLSYALALLGQAAGFAQFPARHVRTSGFMMDREVFSKLRVPAQRTKNDTYRLESGQHSITAQVEAFGLEARVVGRDGVAYGPPDWHASRTFWQENQENLLILDKQTANYAQGDEATRDALSRYAWGAHAAPCSRS